MALLQCLRELHGATGPYLIVVPLSTMPHWVRELNEWTGLDTVVYYGNKDARAVIMKHEWAFPPPSAAAAPKSSGKGAKRPRKILVPKFDVCVTTYEMLTGSIDAFKSVPWQYLIADEAHRLKNREAKALGALRELTCPVKLALTGTPLQNHVSKPRSVYPTLVLTLALALTLTLVR